MMGLDYEKTLKNVSYLIKKKKRIKEKKSFDKCLFNDCKRK